MPLPWIADALRERKRAGLERIPPPIAVAGPTLLLDGREVLNFCSNDYLGFGADPGTRALLASAASTEPASATASRLVCGDLPAHRDAERALATFVGRPQAVLFPSGYAANTAVISSLAGPGDAVLSDRLNHASLIDGIRASRATPLVYRHADVEHAVTLARAHARRQPVRRWLIVTDSLFSMDGDEAPLAALAQLASELEAGLVVDEAHAFGVLGPAGRGLAARDGIVPDVTIGTLGKAFGLAGAFAASAADTATWLRATARPFVYSTGTLPVLARAIADQVVRIEQADDRRERAATLAARVHRHLVALGLRVPEGARANGPIVPWIVGAPAEALRISARLLEHGVFVQPIRPPTVPPGTSRLRIVPTAGHDDTAIDRLLEAIAACREPVR